MSSVTFHFPKHRLSTLLKKPGGKTVADAVTAANQGLATIQADCAAAVAELLVGLNSLWAARRESLDQPALEELYKECNRLVGVADAAGLVALDRSAFSLCDLLDRMMASDRWDRESIEVHIQALNLLQNPQFASQAVVVREVLLGLGEVRARYANGPRA